jgi:2TM domain-containing protein
MAAAPDPHNEEELRAAAVRSVKEKQDFRGHLVAYLLVNALLVGIWAVTGADFFWPIFPILGWGIGIAFHAWDVYGRRPVSEDRIREEMERLRR